MGAARWVVVGTALVAAAVAFHLLLSPHDDRRAVSLPERAAGSAPGTAPAESRTDWGASSGASGNGSVNGRAIPPGGPPQEELDAASRDAMRSFLRQSAQDEEANEAGRGSDP